MKFSVRALAIATVASALTLTATTGAHAQSQKITDKRADVVFYQGDDDEKGTQLNRRDSSASGIDVTSVTVKHAKKSVKVTFKFASLAKKDVLIMGELRTKTRKNKNKNFTFMNLTSQRDVYVLKDKDFDLACEVKAKRKVGKNGTYTVTIARKCLDNPKAIKFRGAASLVDSSALLDDDADVSGYQDAVSPSKVRTPTWGKWLKSN